jgi:Na+/H+ antiporter NhaC
MASGVGSVLAIGMSLVQGLLTPREAVTVYIEGLGTLFEACAILILAWVIKNVCDDFSTGLALVGMVGDGLPAVALPLVIFVLAGVVAFSTGTSWGTMGLLLPVAAPLATALSGELPIILACMGAVLDGAIWGDHCSPISDTTVLSSTATGCPHMDHVKTQLPYAVLAMVVAATFGYLGYALGTPFWVIYPGGFIAMAATLMMVGKKA